MAFEKGRITWNKGLHWTDEIKKKISKKMKGKHWKLSHKKKFSEEHKRKISEAGRGRSSPKGMLGKRHSETTKKRMREHARMKGMFGENHPTWQGGKSFEPYSVDWTEDLKRAIRKRDEYVCQVCGKEPSIVIHHIDYDKKNNNPNNLITLCNSCHSKTNHNRKKWLNYFKKI
jgi:hypothetical protein